MPFPPNPQLKSDEGFQEFLAVHKNRTQVPTWANDALEAGAVEKSKKKEKKAVSDDYLNFDSDDSDESDEQSDDEDEEQNASEDEDKQGASLLIFNIKDKVHKTYLAYITYFALEKEKYFSHTSLLVQLDTQLNNTVLYCN